MLEGNQSGSVHRNPNYQTLLTFKPRQVLLAEQTTKATTTMKQCSNKKTLIPNPDQKALLLHSVLRYLQLNGFSRALKRLLSEAQIENDNWKSCSLDLEDMYINSLEICTRADTKFDCYKDQEVITNGISMKCEDSHHSTLDKTIEKKKKKKNDEGDDNAAANQSETADRIADFAMNSREILANNLPTDSNELITEKKKSKKVSDSVHYAEQVSEQELKEPTSDTVCESQIDESTKKQKKKKKQKSKSISEPIDGNVEQVKSDSLSAGSEEKGENSKPSLGDDSMKSELKKESFLTSEDANDKGKKSSKKRKRSTSEKNDGLPSKESKSRKTEPLEETKSCEQLEKVNGNEYSAHKSRRNHHEGSAEPKTVNAFQRVKLDDVEFADERLQDNSYWAKDGAEVGYGAKAQEILGQVRGRDFRHEKTKKKRGSYRGGQIDLQTHSIKFNYSDED
ncbi:suppressor protein SRP40 isoform X2 [Actinidia eriantha]|uniref:suppressor protein SRP40 isoform X2 n=1 Tax=Actinidia eriantha TaxID=165200 RepID=UPI00258BAD02|nr:suppressor protein SRP40 isoform X2 [Actinidia eriantha]